jgi:hypothetical protein
MSAPGTGFYRSDTPAMPASAAVLAHQRAQGAEVMSEENVHAHMMKLRSQAPVIVNQAAPEDRAEMEKFLEEVRDAVGEPAPPAAPAPADLVLFTDQETASDHAGDGAQITNKRRPGRPRKTASPQAFPADKAPDAPVIPSLVVEFNDDGRQITVRAHAAEVTLDGQGLALLTPLSREARYFPKSDSVLQIKTSKLGDRWIYCPSPSFHVDFPQHGMAVSMYMLIPADEALEFQRRLRLAESRALLSEEHEEQFKG